MMEIIRSENLQALKWFEEMDEKHNIDWTSIRGESGESILQMCLSSSICVMRQFLASLKHDKIAELMMIVDNEGRSLLHSIVLKNDATWNAYAFGQLDDEVLCGYFMKTQKNGKTMAQWTDHAGKTAEDYARERGSHAFEFNAFHSLAYYLQCDLATKKDVVYVDDDYNAFAAYAWVQYLRKEVLRVPPSSGA